MLLVINKLWFGNHETTQLSNGNHRFCLYHVYEAKIHMKQHDLVILQLKAQETSCVKIEAK